MITSNTKTSAVVVTAPRALTKEQREIIRAECASNLPADVGVIVLDPGFAVTAIGASPIHAELQKIARGIQRAIDDLGACAMRTVE